MSKQKFRFIRPVVQTTTQTPLCILQKAGSTNQTAHELYAGETLSLILRCTTHKHRAKYAAVIMKGEWRGADNVYIHTHDNMTVAYLSIQVHTRGTGGWLADYTWAYNDKPPLSFYGKADRSDGGRAEWRCKTLCNLHRRFIWSGRFENIRSK